MKTFKSTLMLIALLLLCHHLNGQAISEKAACNQMQIEIFNVDATKATATNKWCIGSYFLVYDCQMYNAIDGSCKTCPEGSTNVGYTSLFGMTEKACIPLSQQAIGCMKYGRFSPNKYGCIMCSNPTSKIVPIVGNADKKGFACIPDIVPNCQQYKQITSSIIGCDKCKSGFSQYAGEFNFQGGKTNGKACPKDGSIKQCTILTISDGQYTCDTLGCPSGKPTSLTFREGQTSITCIPSPTYPYPYDIMCTVFKKFQTDLTKLQCSKCQPMYQIVSKLQTQTNTLTSACVMSLYAQAGCTEYVTEGSGSPPYCKACDSRYDFLPLNPESASITWDKTIQLGQCFLKDRWNIDLKQTTCKFYSQMVGTIAQPSCQICAATGFNSPCDEPKGTCVNGQRQVSVSGEGRTLKTCSQSPSIIDFCALYFGMASTSSCIKCDQGYELVTTITNPFMPTFMKSCIKKSFVIPSCYIYNNNELTCYQCFTGVDCTKPPQAPPASPFICAKIITVGYSQVCISCPLGYTLKNNSCYKSVERCANLAGDNYCLACVRPDKYQLVENRKCVEIPVFCKSVKIDGTCDICKDGYELDASRNCAPSNNNPCPQEQYLNPQNKCVPGSIKNCLIYVKDGSSCNKCKEKYNLSSDFKKCEPTDKWADFPPCPANNTEFKYERKNNGECLAIDAQCVGYNQDNGYCFECADNEYAYQGLCYKVNFGN